MVKPLTKVKIQPGLSVPCEQSENIGRFHMKGVCGLIFQPIENSAGAE